MQNIGNAWKLRDQQLKTISYISYIYILYMCVCVCIDYYIKNLMGAINKKCTIDTHTQKSNPNTTLKMDIKSQEKRTKEEGKKKDLQKQIQSN